MSFLRVLLVVFVCFALVNAECQDDLRADWENLLNSENCATDECAEDCSKKLCDIEEDILKCSDIDLLEDWQKADDRYKRRCDHFACADKDETCGDSIDDRTKDMLKSAACDDLCSSECRVALCEIKRDSLDCRDVERIVKFLDVEVDYIKECSMTVCKTFTDLDIDSEVPKKCGVDLQAAWDELLANEKCFVDQCAEDCAKDLCKLEEEIIKCGDLDLLDDWAKEERKYERQCDVHVCAGKNEECGKQLDDSLKLLLKDATCDNACNGDCNDALCEVEDDVMDCGDLDSISAWYEFRAEYFVDCREPICGHRGGSFSFSDTSKSTTSKSKSSSGKSTTSKTSSGKSTTSKSSSGKSKSSSSKSKSSSSKSKSSSSKSKSSSDSDKPDCYDEVMQFWENHYNVCEADMCASACVDANCQVEPLLVACEHKDLMKKWGKYLDEYQKICATNFTCEGVPETYFPEPEPDPSSAPEPQPQPQPRPESTDKDKDKTDKSSASKATVSLSVVAIALIYALI